MHRALLSLRLACWLALGPAAGLTPTPLVSVEEGGVALFPCSAPAAKRCLLRPPGGWIMWPYLSTADLPNRTGRAVAHNATHCACALPPADAEAPVDVYFGEPEAAAARPAGRVQYVALWTPSLSRRPYLSTDRFAEVVVGVHDSVADASISLSLADGQVLLGETRVPAGAATVLAFSLAPLPAVAEAQVVARLARSGGSALERRLFLSRAAPPPPTLGSFVQVDYARKVMLVNGRPLLGVGYYDSQSVGPRNVSRQVSYGINWNMRYMNSADPPHPRFPDRFVLDYLDWSRSAGMHVMLDVHEWVQELAGKGNSTELWAAISSTVLKFRDHPALLGWYICDDCMTQWLRRQLSAKTPTIDTLYRALKTLDPWHPLIGASESAQVGMFTTANSFVPAPSLDVVMVENYVSTLSGNSHSGRLFDTGLDGAFRAWPVTWEAMVNCPGPWLVAGRKDISDAEKALNMYSMSWLSAVLAKLPIQLHFRLFPFNSSQPVLEEIMRQVGRYGQVARRVQDFLLAPPSGVREPWLASEEAGPCRQCAAIWRRPAESFCALIVVVNTENTTATAAFQLRGAEDWPDSHAATLRRVDGDRALRLRGGRFEVAMAAFDSHVYVSTACDSADQRVYI